MAFAAAIRTAEARHGHEPLSHSGRDATLQIPGGFADEYLQEAGMGQEIVDVPASSFIDANRYQDVAIHALEAARPSRRAGVRIEPPGKVHNAQGPDRYLLCLRQGKDEGINSRLIFLRLHDKCSGWRLFELDAL